ncbi:MAG: amidohydrolase family protein [Halobacteriales archaeon]|nr:amidohydrolase family protein [Halobacteriales archaeon]
MAADEAVYAGTVLAGADYEPVRGRVVVADGEIQAVEEASVDSTDIICPAFVNAHTHVGDSIAKDAGRGLSLVELVAPPDGLKHRLLEAASPDELVAGMRRSARQMAATGTAAFIDFREGGVVGVDQLREAVEGLAIEAQAYGRGPSEVLEVADGYGAPSARDGDFEAQRGAARAAGKPFAVHAGEADPDDIDGGFELDPDHLVHMVHPEPRHLDRLEETGTPVVVCPRSNAVTGVGTPPVAELVERTAVALGTDNVMLNGPSMFREMAWTAKQSDVADVEVLRMATRAGAELAGLDAGIVEPGRAAKLVVLDGAGDNLAGTEDPVRSVVRRAGAADVVDVVG